MKLLKEKEQFYVETHEDNCGHTGQQTYVFSSKEEVEKFLDLKDGIAVDVYGTTQVKGYHEIVQSVYSNTKYTVDEGKDVDADKMLEIGNDVASLWGASCYDFEIDWNLKEVAFVCIENGEEFTTTMTFDELEEEYDFVVE